jgi:hypothetical protein
MAVRASAKLAKLCCQTPLFLEAAKEAFDEAVLLAGVGRDELLP